MSRPIIFSDVVKEIPRSIFQSIISKYSGDKGVRTLDCWTWFGALLFGQLSGNDSIRAIERVFNSTETRLNKLGFNTVCKSTLADANAKRDPKIFEELFYALLPIARARCPKENLSGINAEALAIDSSTIEMCLSLSPWARFHHEKTNKGAAKLHVGIDIASDLPQFAVITNGKQHDVKVARENWAFKPGTITIFDRGYIDYSWLHDLDQGGVTFVTRAKTNMRYKIVDRRKVNRTHGVMFDQMIELTSLKSKDYPGVLRRIRYIDPDTGKRLVFLTNNFDLSAKMIANLYKARWRIEIFFKVLKQYLRVKKFMGTSENAVKSQIWVALIAYLLVMILRAKHNVRISLSEAMAVIGTLLLFREPIYRVLGELPKTRRHPPPAQLAFNF